MMSCSYLNAGGSGGSGTVGVVKPEPCWMPPFPLPDPPRAQFYRPPRPDPTALPVDLAALPANLAASAPANLPTTSGKLASGASGNLAASLPASVPALDLSTSLKPPPSSDEESE